MYSELIHVKTPDADTAESSVGFARTPVEHALGLARRWAGWRRQRKAAAELMSMPDYILKDIGISRDQIQAVVSGLHGHR